MHLCILKINKYSAITDMLVAKQNWRI